MSKISLNLKKILDKISRASAKRDQSLQYFKPRLVAVSKFKSIEDIIEVYKHGQTHFGENYINELVLKSNDPLIQRECPDIKWHFIGNLQSNKINKLLTVPNLHLIETVDSANLADKLNKNLKINRLNVMIQVNTSTETQKNGVDLDKALELYKHIIQSCKNLELVGLMTIGSLEESCSDDANNKDFQVSKFCNLSRVNLILCKEKICRELGIEAQKIELSMGMSNDFEPAILMGSSNVRIGSSIFGPRK
ncbi:proline synthase co-transcribed bacterial -like protein [Brachionus plicatilis]|uniref:Pyridoxal phosphate homeostasis protein n=1 Tax=Brachionus plicatilis TaxID=10195 RepID=A0A3M7P6M4_BRAPC|nr:proline synthase co-transcribed bacterial -like protein [Brachionus plicatilis]